MALAFVMLAMLGCFVCGGGSGGGGPLSHCCLWEVRMWRRRWLYRNVWHPRFVRLGRRYAHWRRVARELIAMIKTTHFMRR
jgi:hypothetical protein